MFLHRIYLDLPHHLMFGLVCAFLLEFCNRFLKIVAERKGVDVGSWSAGFFNVGYSICP